MSMYKYAVDTMGVQATDKKNERIKGKVNMQIAQRAHFTFQ